ncbi:MAG: TRAP transporter large permease subunit [Proteobacteria bacterium]|nr:TRAP transporter large permease subunit [Pseudomonadota bacterium]
MSGELLASLMFPALFLLVFLGIPISFALFGIAFFFGLPVFGEIVGIQLYNTVLQVATQYLLSAVPPFIFMGAMLERSGIAERLFQALQLWLGKLNGGLALATMIMGAIFAASTGIVGAVEVVIGLMAIPAMMTYNYDRDLIAGTICAGGSLGTMIPPSLVVVIYASVAQMSVGQLFAAMLIPAGIMVALFLGYIVLRCLLRPDDGPAAAEVADVPFWEKVVVTFTALVPATALIVAVLGSIMLGVASPTEAASVGAVGVFILAGLYGKLNFKMMTQTLRSTLVVNSMIMMIVTAGTMFSNIFRVHGGHRLVDDTLNYLELGPSGTIAICLFIVFLLGFILDWVSIVLICLPIFLPALAGHGVEPVWFAVLMMIVIQTSYLTPPMAPSIFYLRSIAPPQITYKDMYLGVAPFVACQVVVLLLVLALPWLATYLPRALVSM